MNTELQKALARIAELEQENSLLKERLDNAKTAIASSFILAVQKDVLNEHELIAYTILALQEWKRQS